MPAPTWPPDPKEAFKLTAREYGVDPADLGMDPDDDQQAEQAILAAFLFKNPGRQLTTGEKVGLGLDETRRSMAAWLAMVTGRRFPIAPSDPAATDGNVIFLPQALPPPLEHTDSLLFRAMALLQAGFLQHGVLNSQAVLRSIYDDWVLRSCFHLLAARYVVGRWSAAYPGIARDFRATAILDKAAIMRVNLTVVPTQGMPAAFKPLYKGLLAGENWREAGPEAAAAQRAVAAVDAITRQQAAIPVILGQARRLREAYRRMHLGPPPAPYFTGILRPEWMLALRAHDQAAEDAWKQGPTPLRQLRAAVATQGHSGGLSRKGPRGGLGLRQFIKKKVRRTLQGPGEPGELARSPAYGELRDQYRSRQHSPSPGSWTPEASWQELVDIPPAAGHEDGVPYDEWDPSSGTYRLAACRVLDRPAQAGPADSYHRLVQANRGPITQVRRAFQALRQEERWLHGRPEGSDIDIDRVIASFCDVHSGMEPDRNIYMSFQREREQVAILVMVDLSGSTVGRVIHLEQEALVILAEGLRTLGFPHAFYGFHNHGPRACQMERIKGFDEQYGEPVFKRMGNLQPGGATRLGAFIRHGAHLLSQQPQSRRIMLVLSDGRPEDRDGYRGRQGIEDSAMAVHEAQRLGVHIHCTSLDPSTGAPEYLGRIFGRGRFLVLPDVDPLPRKLPQVLRGLIR